VAWPKVEGAVAAGGALVEGAEEAVEDGVEGGGARPGAGATGGLDGSAA
jgi:hypothetical protein